MHCCIRDLAAAYDGHLQTSDRVAGVSGDNLCTVKVRGGLNESSRAVVLIAAREEGAESSAREETRSDKRKQEIIVIQ